MSTDVTAHKGLLHRNIPCFASFQDTLISIITLSAENFINMQSLCQRNISRHFISSKPRVNTCFSTLIMFGKIFASSTIGCSSL